MKLDGPLSGIWLTRLLWISAAFPARRLRRFGPRLRLPDRRLRLLLLFLLVPPKEDCEQHSTKATISQYPNRMRICQYISTSRKYDRVRRGDQGGGGQNAFRFVLRYYAFGFMDMGGVCEKGERSAASAYTPADIGRAPSNVQGKDSLYRDISPPVGLKDHACPLPTASIPPF